MPTINSIKNEFELLAGGKISSKPIGHVHDMYLCGEILGPENYIDYFEVIRNSSDNDIVRLHINSSGGDMSTAIQFVRAIQESPSHVVASAEGYCMSAATMIFLTADGFEISDHCLFMFHNYSGFSFGKGGEMYDQILNERKWSEKIIHSVYKDFLTEDEIKAILDNKDIWMDGEEVKVRLEAKIEKVNAEAEAMMQQEEVVVEEKPIRKKRVTKG